MDEHRTTDNRFLCFSIKFLLRRWALAVNGSNDSCNWNEPRIKCCLHFSCPCQEIEFDVCTETNWRTVCWRLVRCEKQILNTHRNDIMAWHTITSVDDVRREPRPERIRIWRSNVLKWKLQCRSFRIDWIIESISDSALLLHHNHRLLCAWSEFEMKKKTPICCFIYTLPRKGRTIHGNRFDWGDHFTESTAQRVYNPHIVTASQKLNENWVGRSRFGGSAVGDLHNLTA